MKEEKAKKRQKLTEVPRLQRPKVLLEAFLAFPSSTPYGERIKSLAAYYKTSERNIYQTAQRHKWREHIEAVAEVQRSQEAWEQALITTAPTRQDIPYSVVARSIKDLSFTLLATAQKVVRGVSVLIDYYVGEIEALLASKGGYAYLTEEDKQEIAGWQAQIATQAKSIESYLKPGALASLLDQINFRSNLPTNLEDVDASAFTPQRLQQTLIDLGMVTAFDLARRDGEEERFAPYTEVPDLPALDGWSNARPINNTNETHS